MAIPIGNARVRRAARGGGVADGLVQRGAARFGDGRARLMQPEMAFIAGTTF